MKIIKLNVLLSITFMIAIVGFVSCEEDDEMKPSSSNDNANKWQVELVDSISGVNVGNYNKLVIDVDSGIHIAYTVTGDQISLKYAYKPYGGNWEKTVVENILSDDIIDIAVDNQNNVFIAYRAYKNGTDGSEIMYIAEKSINGAFNKVKVDVLGDQSFQARYPAIYADNNNTIHMSFERANYGMRYTSYKYQSAFSGVETLDDNISSSSSDIVIDSEGNKHIIHFHSEKVYHSYCGHSENTWTVNQIATGDVSSASYESVGLAVDQFDNIHATYRYGSTTQDNNIHYLYKAAASASWQEEAIGNSGGSSRLDRAIACDTLGNPYVLYDESFGLRIAAKNGSWSHDSIMGDSNYRCDINYDIEIPANNRAHVSFYCRTTGVLRYATKVLD